MNKMVFRLPDIGEGAVEAEVVCWHVQVGERVHEDQLLVEVMTDKASVEISAPVDGVILSLAGAPGDKVAVGAELAVFDVGAAASGALQQTPGSQSDSDAHGAAGPRGALSGSAAETGERDIDARSAAAPAALPEGVEPLPQHRPSTLAGAQPSGAGGEGRGKPAASPALRRRARIAGVRLEEIEGSGPAGRITHDDLDRYLKGNEGERPQPAASGAALVEEVKIIGLRRKIAEKMQQSARQIPHFGYVEEVDVTEVSDLREYLNANRRPEQTKLSLLPFLIRGTVIALRDFPAMNARFDDDAGILRKYGAANIGIATQTPSGLVVPVLKGANGLRLWDCAAEVRRITEAARRARSSREDLSGGTITITSLGALGGIATSPLINYPEVAIIGVNKIAVRPVWRDNQFVPRRIMNISAAFDHRVIDGWDGANFIQRIRTLLERPALLGLEV